MKAKFILILFMLFLIDLRRPFGPGLSVEFLLLGIIFISFNLKGRQALIISVLFGYLKDAVSGAPKPVYTIEFPAVCFAIQYLLSRFPLNEFASKKAHIWAVKNILILITLTAHVIFNSFYNWVFLPFFSLKFIVQSIFVYYVVSHLLKKIILFAPVNDTA